MTDFTNDYRDYRLGFIHGINESYYQVFKYQADTLLKDSSDYFMLTEILNILAKISEDRHGEYVALIVGNIMQNNEKGMNKRCDDHIKEMKININIQFSEFNDAYLADIALAHDNIQSIASDNLNELMNIIKNRVLEFKNKMEKKK